MNGPTDDEERAGVTDGPYTRYLEHVASEHLPSFDIWFPATFDWLRLCADVPAMALAAGRPVPGDLTGNDVEAMAKAVFMTAHLYGLATLCAADDDDADPEGALASLTSPPGEMEEEAFSRLVGERLRDVEERLAAGEDAPGCAPAEVAVAASNADSIWAPIAEILAADEGGVFERAGPAADLLWGVARVAAILAVFRWMANEEALSDAENADL